MLVNKLPELVAARGVNIQDVAKATGLNYGTVRHLILGHSDRFDKKTLARMCAYFGVQLNEIFEWVPSEASADGD